MCFSAPVSFAASAFVAGAGALALRETRTVTERPFASVPLLFAMQQFVEGVLWLLLPQIGTGGASHLLVQVYAFFIGVIWPMVIPLGILLIEPDRLRKRLMMGVLAIGIMVAIGTFIIILRYGVNLAVVNHCLVYSIPSAAGCWCVRPMSSPPAPLTLCRRIAACAGSASPCWAALVSPTVSIT